MSTQDMITYAVPGLGIVALLYTVWKSSWVSNQEVGTDRMARIAKNISDGAMAFLKAEYKVLAVFVLVVAALLAWSGYSSADSSPLVAFSFILGAICSAGAGFIGMKVATKANVRTTNAARTSLGKALEVAFAGGAVMGLGVVGLGVLGLGALFLAYSNLFFAADGAMDINKVLTVITGFSFGA
ncbi:MAG: sodium/proton-translocating pyrophosphatase, partial [Bacteroidetes bacterium]|nr:sodium/proton-translocating pyrophosphatase [Bacteroidota bacterium]